MLPFPVGSIARFSSLVLCGPEWAMLEFTPLTCLLKKQEAIANFWDACQVASCKDKQAVLRLDMKHAEAIGGVVLKLPSLQAVWHFDASCVYAEAAVVRVGTAKPQEALLSISFAASKVTSRTTSQRNWNNLSPGSSSENLTHSPNLSERCCNFLPSYTLNPKFLYHPRAPKP